MRLPYSSSADAPAIKTSSSIIMFVKQVAHQHPLQRRLLRSLDLTQFKNNRRRVLLLRLACNAACRKPIGEIGVEALAVLQIPQNGCVNLIKPQGRKAHRNGLGAHAVAGARELHVLLKIPAQFLEVSGGQGRQQREGRSHRLAGGVLPVSQICRRGIDGCETATDLHQP